MAPPVHRARRARIPLAATLALSCMAGGAFAQAVSPAPVLSAQRIVIDSVTGRPRMPDHEEFAAMKEASAAAAATQRSAAVAARGAAPSFSSHPVLQRMQGQPLATKFGALGRRVGAEKLSFSVVQRTADGRFETQCLTGEDAATHALHAEAKEVSHAQ